MLTKLFLGQDERDIKAAVRQIAKDMLFVLIAISGAITIILETTFEKWRDVSASSNPWPLAIVVGIIIFLIGSWVTIYLESKFQKIYRQSEERVRNSKVPLSITRK